MSFSSEKQKIKPKRYNSHDPQSSQNPDILFYKRKNNMPITPKSIAENQKRQDPDKGTRIGINGKSFERKVCYPSNVRSHIEYPWDDIDRKCTHLDSITITL